MITDYSSRWLILLCICSRGLASSFALPTPRAAPYPSTLARTPALLQILSTPSHYIPANRRHPKTSRLALWCRPLFVPFISESALNDIRWLSSRLCGSFLTSLGTCKILVQEFPCLVSFGRAKPLETMLCSAPTLLEKVHSSEASPSVLNRPVRRTAPRPSVSVLPQDGRNVGRYPPSSGGYCISLD